MAGISYYILISSFFLTCAILAYTSFTDVKKRTINSFIFLPLIGLGAWFHASQGAPLFFLVIGILIFLATYLETDLVIYPVIGIIFLAVSLYYVLSGSILYGFTATLMSMIFLVGFQERFFGIGDVKAMIALFFVFTQFPFLTSLTAGQSYLVSILPLSIVMLFNIAVVSLFFIPYILILGRRNGDRLGVYSITSLKYDESVYSRNQAKFNVRNSSKGKLMVYKTPFMVSVSIGFLLTIFIGFWFILV